MATSIKKVTVGSSGNSSYNTSNISNNNNNVVYESMNLSSDHYSLDRDYNQFYVNQKGYMIGDETGFNGSGNVTRAQLVQVLYAMEGKPSGANANFKDVNSNDWYSDAVAWAQSNGIVAGHTDGTFRPNDVITREQMAAVMSQYARYKGANTSASSYTVESINKTNANDYAKNSLAWAYEKGMFDVSSIENLNPGGGASRNDLAQMLTAYDANYNNSSFNQYYEYYKNPESFAINSINTSLSEKRGYTDVFNDTNYGGDQRQVSKIMKKYNSEAELLSDSSVDGQQARIINDLIKKYYPNSTYDQRKLLAESYTQNGCAYMALADGLALQTSGLSNGEEVFKKAFGYDLYSTDGNNKVCNTEAIAMDFFLYENCRNKSIDSVLSLETTATNTASGDVRSYLNSKGITTDYSSADFGGISLTSKTESLKKLAEFEMKHQDAIYMMEGGGYNMNRYNNQGDLTNNTTRASAHATFVTGMDNDSLTVSSWGDKYDVPIGTDGSRISVVAYNFDFSKIGGKK